MRTHVLLVYIMKYTCDLCGKEYTNRGSLRRHQTLCEFTNATARQKQVYVEETTDLPSYEQLVQIVQQMAGRLARDETRIAKLEKESSLIMREKLDPKKWLDESVKCEYEYSQHADHIVVTQNMAESLFHDKPMDVFATILCESYEKGRAPFAYIKNQMYCYHAESGWRVMEKQELLNVFNKIHQRLMNELHTWRQINAMRIDSSDSLSVTYNKTLIKLLNMNFTQEAVWCKTKSTLENAVKYEVKNIIEYVIE